MLSRVLFYFVLFIFFLLFSVACPYSFNNQLPKHLKTIAVPLFADKTFEFGLKERLTNSIIKQFMETNALKVTDLQHADSVFKGTIKSYKKSVASYDSNEKVNEWELKITVSVEFKDLKKDKVIYKKKNKSLTIRYSEGGDEEENKNVLISNLAKELVKEALTTW